MFSPRWLGLVVARRVLVSGVGRQSQSSLAPPVQPAIATRVVAFLTVIVIMVAAVPGMAAAETMESALARAYQGNPQLNAQRAIVRQNDEGVSQALSGYRPTLSATASVGQQYTNETGVFPRSRRCSPTASPSPSRA
jgi:Outer membrane efflux protein